MSKDKPATTRNDPSPTISMPAHGKSIGGDTLGGGILSRESIGEKIGSQIGPFTLLEPIGEGGMGSVYLAEQTSPVSRRVALKIIKPGMDSRQVISRFDVERQAISMMEHPNIVRVLDVGTTAEGRPYFAMELVHGMPITKYCDEKRLGVKQRLDLFKATCNGVQHAHQKGIVHRDLKPSNVLVTELDGKILPKIIDFGLAKALHQSVPDKSMFTQMGQVVGTLEYMSPEQSGLDPADVDTRTDIYSLGVLLYELLTGTTPFDRQRMRSASLDQVLKSIRETDALKPSHRLSSVKSSAEVATNRGTELKRLSGQLRGDLDWIVMKALEKDPSRRYETANGLEMDIQRFLNGEPVLAAPPSVAYRCKKFVHRNQLGVIAAGLVALALVLGLIGTVYGLRQAVAAGEREKTAKLAAQTEATRAVNAEAEANARAKELKLVADFQSGMLEQIDATNAGLGLTKSVAAKFAESLAKANVPEADRAAQVTAFLVQWRKVNATDTARELIDRTILQPAIGTIDKQFKEQPVIDAQLRQTLANRYEQLGLYDAALPLQTSALTTRRRELGEEHPDTLVSINGLGVLLQRLGKLSEAEPFYREALDKRRQVLGNEHPDTLQSIGWLGYLLDEQGNFAAAEPLLRESLGTSRKVLGEDHPTTLDGIAALGFCLARQRKYDEAEPFVREALEKRRRVLGNEHRDIVASLSHLGALLSEQRRFADAEPNLRDGLETSKRVLGEEHPDTLTLLNRLCKVLQDQGKLSEAEPYYRQALEISRGVLGNAHPDTLLTINNLGMLLRSQGKLSDAEPYYQEALKTSRDLLGDEHPDTLRALNNMGALLWSQERYAEAERYVREALETRRRVAGEEHRDTLVSLNNLGGLLRDQGKLAEAETCYREVVTKSSRAFGEEHGNTLIFTTNLGSVLVAQGNCVEGEALLASVEGKMRNAFSGANAFRLAFLLTNLGRARGKLAKDSNGFAAAEANLLEAHENYTKTPGPSPKDARDCTQALVDFYTAWDQAEPGKGYDTRSAEWKAKLEASAPVKGT